MEGVEGRLGAGVLAALALAVGLVLGLQGRHLRGGLELRVEMAQAGGLAEGSKVRIAGLTLGTVDRISLGAQGRVLLDLWIDRRHAWLLRDNSELFVNQSGLLGEPYLEVGARPGQAPGRPLEDGATVHGIDPPRLDQLMRTSYENLRAVADMMHSGFPEVAALRLAAEQLEKTLVSLDPQPGAARASWLAQKRMLAEGALLLAAARATGVSPPDLARAGRDARSLAERARADLAGIARQGDALAAAARRLAAHTGDARLAALATALDATAATAARLDHALAGAEAIRQAVARGENTIGALLLDAELADEFKDMSKTLKQQPWNAIGHPDQGARPR